MQVSRPPVRAQAFTLVELLAVITIIAILTGLILGTASFVQKKAARSRAEAEIAALSAAMERYKADNGIYPVSTPSTPLTGTESRPDAYLDKPAAAGSLALYAALSGDLNADGDHGDTVGGLVEKDQKTYFEFKPTMLKLTGTTVTAIVDPFGNNYGYYAPEGTTAKPIQRNPTFDLWSTAGRESSEFGTPAAFEGAWIKNW